VLVQVTKDPVGQKGARLSTQISLAGRFLVYVPDGNSAGISRKLPDTERRRLKAILKDVVPEGSGVIIRTAAEGVSEEEIGRDVERLATQWTEISEAADKRKGSGSGTPVALYEEPDLLVKVVRDLFNEDFTKLVIQGETSWKTVHDYVMRVAPEMVERLERYDNPDVDVFTTHRVDEQLAKALERKVWLPSGGSLVIDRTEAMTVIDVNTGRFTGAGGNLEATVTSNNLEAAEEVVRQLRLRDIGGIIIIDFIDMAHAKNRELVLATLEAELETDRTKTYVVELSPLGLVEMTRQNTTDGARGILTRACPTCSGKGRVLSEETMALNVERRLRALARKSQAKAWLVEINGGVAERLSGARLKRLEKQVGRRIFIEGGSSLPVDAFRVISEGSLEHVQEQRIPVREGQEVTVELEFSLTYSPRDAVGYVDGYMVIVEGGRKHLGKRRKVRITATDRAAARATLPKKGAEEAN